MNHLASSYDLFKKEMPLRAFLLVVILSGLPWVSRAQDTLESVREVALLVGHEAETSAQSKIFNECASLDADLRQAFVKHLGDLKYSVRDMNSSQVNPGDKLLDAKTVDVISEGNAFLGHKKVLAVKLDVYVDGIKIKTRKITSNLYSTSMNSSCNVLTRQVQDVASQLVAWFNKLK